MMVRRRAWLLVIGILLVPGSVSRLAGEAVAASGSAGHWTTVGEIPWGRGDHALFEDLASTDSHQVYRGPTRFLALGGGKVAILDTLASAVKELDASGRIVRTLGFPSHDEHDAETEAIDMAVAPGGSYWLLSQGRRALVRVGGGAEPGGIIESRPIVGLKPDSIPTRIASDDRGDLFLLDSNSNTVLRWDASGAVLPAGTSDLAASMVVDGQGNFVGWRLAQRSDLRHVELVRWTPPRSSTRIATVSSLADISRFDVFGVDRGGNVYAMVAQGAIEHPRHTRVMRFDPAGHLTGRVDSPPDPAELPLLHGKAVSPDGTVYAVTVTAQGLKVLRLDSF